MCRTRLSSTKPVDARKVWNAGSSASSPRVTLTLTCTQQHENYNNNWFSKEAEVKPTQPHHTAEAAPGSTAFDKLAARVRNSLRGIPPGVTACSSIVPGDATVTSSNETSSGLTTSNGASSVRELGAEGGIVGDVFALDEREPACLWPGVIAE